MDRAELSIRARGGDGAQVGASPAEPSHANLPNAITMAGYGLAIGWLAGGPWWMGAASVIADEVDGRVARATGEATEFGGLLDWATDITLTGLVAAEAGLLWSLPLVTWIQTELRHRGERPTVGSVRALLTLYLMAKGRGDE